MVSPSSHRGRLTALALLAVLATRCNGLADRTTVAPPLVTVHGTMTLAPGTTVGGDLRLALAWYPGLLNYAADDPNAPPSCGFSIALQTVAQGLAYRPNFPIDYTFDITALPPTSVQTSIPDPFASPIKTAIGALVAYEDRNRNGILDRCDGPACTDRILGASSGYLPGFLPGQTEMFVAYQNNISTASNPVVNSGFYLDAIGAATNDAGFNPSTLLPLPQTPIDLALSDAPILETMACNDICVQRGTMTTCAIADVDCGEPTWPKDTKISCPSPSEIQWIASDGCTVKVNDYVVDAGRAPPAWWPCQ
jgi:hypothetical protein